MSDPGPPITLKSGDALIVVDVQIDFLPGGALGVPCGDEVVPVLHRVAERFEQQGLPMFATRDWHPQNHCSFQEQGGPWPPHCVAETEGARFAEGLRLPPSTEIVSKAQTPEKDAYSGFQGTDLEARLKTLGVRRLFIGGLATDYCVLNTVQDALQAGFKVFLLEDAVRAVNVQPGDGDQALDRMTKKGARRCREPDLRVSVPEASPLFTDLYQLTMLQAYYDSGMNDTAVFEFFVRALPPDRGFLMAAGLEQVLQYLETVRFSEEEREWLKESGRFHEKFVDSLEPFRFTGDVHAMPEGTLFFPDEPILRVTAPLPQAQLLETRIINLLQFQIMIASKAARMVLAAPGKTLVDFGFRRAHGGEAGLYAARASYLAGFQGTATVQAGFFWEIPIFGTMAHSYIQAHDQEEAAFEQFARSHPDNVILLIDTYDTERAAEKVVALYPRLKKEGIVVRGVRLDSGNLAEHAVAVRKILDEGGLKDVSIFASGNLDESALQEFVQMQAPLNGFGIGTRVTTSEDAPSLNCAYKLQEYAGRPRRKRSEGKATWPGAKQVLREYDDRGRMVGDRLVLSKESGAGEPLIEPVLRAGRRLHFPPSPARIRERAAHQLQRLPDPLRALKTDPPYPVEISQALRDLADSLDRQNR